MYVPVSMPNQQNGVTLDFSSSVMMSDEMLIQSLSNINTFVKKIVFSIIVFYCILKIMSSSLHSLIEYQVLCFVVPAFTLGFQYFIGSTQHFVLSIVIIFSYFIGKNILSSVKRGLFYVKCTCYILVFYFIYRIYVLVLALFDSLN